MRDTVLVLIVLLIGGLTFTHAEALAIPPLISHSPLIFWMYALLHVVPAANVIGSTENVVAVLIGRCASMPVASALTSALGALTFLTTTSFLLSTPGYFGSRLSGFEHDRRVPIKDIVLLGGCVFTAAQALCAVLSSDARPKPADASVLDRARGGTFALQQKLQRR